MRARTGNAADQVSAHSLSFRQRTDAQRNGNEEAKVAEGDATLIDELAVDTVRNGPAERERDEQAGRRDGAGRLGVLLEDGQICLESDEEQDCAISLAPTAGRQTEYEADVGDHAELWNRGAWEDVRREAGDAAEHAGAEQQAGDDVADDARLLDLAEEDIDDLRDERGACAARRTRLSTMMMPA